MAPRVKFTRDEMVQAALSVVKAKGISALTARAIADELGVSTQPVFTCFNTMEEAKREVRAAAMALYLIVDGVRGRKKLLRRLRKKRQTTLRL